MNHTGVEGMDVCEKLPASESTEAHLVRPSTSVNVTLAVVREAAIEVIDQLIAKIDHHLRCVNMKIEKLNLDRSREIKKQNLTTLKIPIGDFMPPYFRTENKRVPPLNNEAKKKRENCDFDPLIKEARRWSQREVATLRHSVREELAFAHTHDLTAKIELLGEKIRTAGAETNREEINEWLLQKGILLRKRDFAMQDDSILMYDTTAVNWHRISSKAFNGTRTPVELRLRWINEDSPAINKAPWTSEELTKLHDLTKDKRHFINWALLAEQLGTGRTPFCVFQKFQEEVASHTMRPWTSEEEEKLLGVVDMIRQGENISWDKVCMYMPGRTYKQCKRRFEHQLNRGIRHGRWTEEEDVLLLCAVEKYGTKAWQQICKQVPGRSDSQCRDRWSNILSLGRDPPAVVNGWTLKEDEKLMAGVQVFGKSRWRAICDFCLPHRRPLHIRSRYLSLVTTKLRIAADQVDLVRRTQEAITTRHSLMTTQRLRVFERFKEILGDGDSAAEQVEALCERHYEEVRANHPVLATEEEREQATLRMLEIDNLHAREEAEAPDRADAAMRVLDMINVTDEDAMDLERRLELKRKQYRPRSVYHRLSSLVPSIGPVAGMSGLAIARRLRRPLKAAPSTGEILKKIESEEDDKQMIEKLAILTRLHDDYYSSRAIQSNVRLQNEMKTGFVDSFQTKFWDAPTSSTETIPPNLGTLAAFYQFQHDRPNLVSLASQLFDRVEKAGTDPLSAETRLNIQLSKEISESYEFRALKARVRSMLLEPAQLDAAVLLEHQEEQWKRQAEVIHETTQHAPKTPHHNKVASRKRNVEGTVLFDIEREVEEHRRRVSELIPMNLSSSDSPTLPEPNSPAASSVSIIEEIGSVIPLPPPPPSPLIKKK